MSEDFITNIKFAADKNDLSLTILWLDDDTIGDTFFLDNVQVVTAKSCKRADEKLHKDVVFSGAVIDIIVPQEGWGEHYYKYAGLEFVRYLRKTFDDELKVFVLTNQIPWALNKADIINAGAKNVLLKKDCGLRNLLPCFFSND
ncbi:MAG TPA: hypothetical protein PKW95_18110 [bacterium]|mgnify:CR=1 FL=1|nr:hypothetical protein [bacterium]